MHSILMKPYLLFVSSVSHDIAMLIILYCSPCMFLNAPRPPGRGRYFDSWNKIKYPTMGLPRGMLSVAIGGGYIWSVEVGGGGHVIYRVLHNSLPFSFPKIFMWSCLLWLSVTVSPSAVQRTWAKTTLNQPFCETKMLLLVSVSLVVLLFHKFEPQKLFKWTSNTKTSFYRG